MFLIDRHPFSDRSTGVILSADRAIILGFISPAEALDHKNLPLEIVFESVKETKIGVKIKAKVSFGDEPYQKKDILIEATPLSPEQKTGLAIALLFKKRRKEDAGDKERKMALVLLEAAAGWSGYKSYIPFHLILEEGLKKLSSFDQEEKAMVYQALELNDTPAEFFLKLYHEEKNELKKISILKKGFKKHPNNFRLAYLYSDYLYRERDYPECEKVIKAALAKNKGERNAQEIELLFLCYCAQKNYENAEKLIKESGLRDEDKALFLGILQCQQKKYKDAIPFFYQIIDCVPPDSEEAITATYYLLECYLEEGNRNKIYFILSNLPESTDCAVVPYRIINIETVVLRALRKCLLIKDLGELECAKVKGHIGAIYENRLPNLSKFYEEVREQLTKDEVALMREAQKLLKEALIFYPGVKSFSKAYADILYREKDYDGALKYSLKTFDGDNQSAWTETETIDLNQCSEDVIKNYPEFLEENLPTSDRGRYVAARLKHDVRSLWQLKRYDLISSLYHRFENDLDYTELKEQKKNETIFYSDCLFEIAYSLANQDKKEDAKLIYERYLEINGQNAGALNNLALIYEKESDTKKAKELIKKAKALAGDNDELIDRNFKRIVGNTSKKKRPQLSRPTQPKEKSKAIPGFNENTGVVSYGNKECPIPVGTNEYYICKQLFQAGIDTRVKETDIMTEIDALKAKEENARTIYDAQRRINRKISGSLGIYKLIGFQASSLWLRKEALQ